MINRTQFIALDGQAAHLLRTDSNKRVIVRADLVRNAPLEVLEATRFFAAIARTNLRTKRDLIHTKISPNHPLSDDELAHALRLIEDAYGISPTMPRTVVQHAKGDRPDHFHVLWPVVDPKTGRAIKSNDNFLLDEAVGRRLEIAFGEKITPGPRMTEVIELLEARGLQDEAHALRAYEPVESGDRLDTGTRQQAARLKVDAAQIGDKAYSAWQAAGGDGRQFKSAISEIGLRLAAGHHAVMIVHDESAFAAPLGRMLRQRAKANGTPLKLPEREMQRLFPSLPKLNDAKADGLAAATVKAQTAVDKELIAFAHEAKLDGNGLIKERIRRRREQAKKRAAAEFRATLKARREAIVVLYRRRDRIRRARVQRAFLVAGILGTPARRELAAKAVAAGVLLAGGGLGFALVAGGVAMMVLPSRERARAMAFAARAERTADNRRRQKAILEVYADLRNCAAQKQQDDAKTLATLDGETLLVASGYAHRLLAKDPRGAEHEADTTEKLIKARLGEGVATAVRRQLDDGAGPEIFALLRAFNPRSAEDRAAMARQLGDQSCPAIPGDQHSRIARAGRPVRQRGRGQARTTDWGR